MTVVPSSLTHSPPVNSQHFSCVAETKPKYGTFFNFYVPLSGLCPSRGALAERVAPRIAHRDYAVTNPGAVILGKITVAGEML